MFAAPWISDRLIEPYDYVRDGRDDPPATCINWWHSHLILNSRRLTLPRSNLPATQEGEKGVFQQPGNLPGQSGRTGLEKHIRQPARASSHRHISTHDTQLPTNMLKFVAATAENKVMLAAVPLSAVSNAQRGSSGLARPRQQKKLAAGLHPINRS